MCFCSSNGQTNITEFTKFGIEDQFQFHFHVGYIQAQLYNISDKRSEGSSLFSMLTSHQANIGSRLKSNLIFLSLLDSDENNYINYKYFEFCAIDLLQNYQQSSSFKHLRLKWQHRISLKVRFYSNLIRDQYKHIFAILEAIDFDNI